MMHLMVHYHCSNIDLALMLLAKIQLLLVGSFTSVFSLKLFASSICKIFGYRQVLLHFMERSNPSGGMVRFIPQIQSALSNDPNMTLKYSSCDGVPAAITLPLNFLFTQPFH
jgi:hypothetical protein